MQTLLSCYPSERASFSVLFASCFLLAMASLVTDVECFPVADSSHVTASPVASTTPSVDELLRLYNVSREEIESSRQQHLAAHHSSSAAAAAAAAIEAASVNQFQPAVRQHANQPHVQHSETATLPISASVVQKALRNR